VGDSVTALSEIREAISIERNKGVLELGRKPRLVVQIGDSAAYSVLAAMHFRPGQEKRLPTEIDEVPVERAKDFPGWAVVRR